MKNAFIAKAYEYFLKPNEYTLVKIGISLYSTIVR